MDNFTVPAYMQEMIKASGQGLDNLVLTLAKLVNQPVIVASSAYKLISASSRYDFELFQVQLDSPKVDNNTLFLCRLSAGTFQARAVGQAIAPAGCILGYIFILWEVNNPEPDINKSLLDYAASLCAVHLQSRLELKQELNKFKNSFLYDLLYGNLKRNEEIIATGEMWGWDFRDPHSVAIFILPELEHHSPERHLMDVLTRIVEQVFIDTYYKNPPTIVRQNELVILVPAPEDKPAKQKTEILEFAGKIFTHAEATELKSRIACGIGQAYANAVDLFRSYQEAKVSCEMGRLLNIPVPFFTELGLERILYKHDLQDLKEYYNHVLGELHKKDDPEGSLVNILENFADNQFDVGKTAKALFLHPNTLRYRLSKIESILGKSLLDNNTRLDIVAALKIKRLHKIDQESV